jgi:hypothetical protein
MADKYYGVHLKNNFNRNKLEHGNLTIIKVNKITKKNLWTFGERLVTIIVKRTIWNMLIIMMLYPSKEKDCKMFILFCYWTHQDR